ncbi:MAG: cytochrome c family protein [Spirochaetes bacterium]|nr:cytochrome c family protein [Spirochaetota bacterium]
MAGKRLIILSIFSVGIVLVVLNSAYSRRRIPEYVGVDVCKKCHGMESIGNQYKIWSTSNHANAFMRLKTTKALEIAQKIGVEAPHAELQCLKCHTTGGGKSERVKNEGVGCEACHGPGEDYFEFSNHASFIDRENAYRKAISLGMYPILGVEGIKARERLCKNCHRDERPCSPADIEEKKRRELSLSIIADLPSKLRHPLRR